MGKTRNVNVDDKEAVVWARRRNRDRGATGWEVPRESESLNPPADLKQDLYKCEECGGAESFSLVGDKRAPKDAGILKLSLDSNLAMISMRPERA